MKSTHEREGSSVRSIGETGVSSSTSKFSRKSKTSSILLAFTCGLCAALSLLCCCLITFVLLISNQVTTANALVDSHGRDLLRNMGKETTPTDRLSKEVRPKHYDLYLHPDLNKGTFQGRVTISINILEPRSYIALHQKDLNIISSKLNVIDNEGDPEIELADTYNIDKLEMFIVSTKQDVEPGMYNLTLEFNGSLLNKIVGFYSSTYKDIHNKTRYIATTKFEPTYARRAFPCFDEPDFKAEFTIHLVHPTGDCYSALSNMNVENVAVNKPSTGLSTVTFAKSVPMATYVTCFIVSDFVAVTKNAKGLDGKTYPISVYTTSAQKEKGQFALDVGVKVIEYYVNLFSIDYPLPKLDMAAIPDFVSGAMENWGLVTYRETHLLYDEKTSSVSNKQMVAIAVAHEFAHMWFGNLVTMSWWNDLWLNEGFATYMSYKCINSILPDWKAMDRFLVSQMHVAFVTDAKLSSHPIVQTVSNPDEINAIFDVISYNKGSSILRMLNNFVGAEVFDSGITMYLKKFSYQNAGTADLYSILQESIGNKINITAILDTWTRQMGFPVVNVEKIKYTYILTQKRFLLDPEAEYDTAESNYRYRWTIPITYITSKNSTPTLIWFDKDEMSLTIKLDEPVDWIKFNSDQVGYYRINYEDTEWQALTDVLRWSHKRFTVADRTNLLEDAFSLAEASQLDYNVPMNLTVYLPQEQNDVPWTIINSKFKKIDKMLLSTHISTKFREYVRNLVDTTYHDVTWKVDNTEDSVTLNLRVMVLSLACSVGHIECLEEGGAILKSWINDPNDVRPHPDIRNLVYYYGMNYVGGHEEWNTMFQKFTNETESIEKNKLMRGLAGIRDSGILREFISIAMDEKYVRSQDALTCLRLIADNPVGTSLVWDWVRENWEVLVKRYTLNDRYLGQLIPGITDSFATETKLNEMKAFFEKYPESGAGKVYRLQALETVSNNIKWIKRNADQLERWLDSHRITN